LGVCIVNTEALIDVNTVWL